MQLPVAGDIDPCSVAPVNASTASRCPMFRVSVKIASECRGFNRKFMDSLGNIVRTEGSCHSLGA